MDDIKIENWAEPKKRYRWNEPAINPSRGRKEVIPRNIIMKPSGQHYDDLFLSLCAVVTELMELEEARNETKSR